LRKQTAGDDHSKRQAHRPQTDGDGPIIKHGWDVGQFLKGLGRNARS
jgi:hypothetical protein